MTADQQLPTWMDAPKGPPPPLPPHDDPNDAYEASPPPSALLIFMATLNLLYALGCGCIFGSTATVPTTFAYKAAKGESFAKDEADQEAMRALTTQFFEADVEKSRGSREKTEAERARMEEALRAVAERSIKETASRSGFGNLRAGVVATSIGHAVLFLGAILLLARIRQGLPLSSLACVAILVGGALSIGALGDVQRTFADAFVEAARDPELTGELSELERGELAGVAQGDFIQGAYFVGFVGVVGTALWPLIALVVFAASRSIRASLRRPEY
jgi:hypothetical protein